MRSVYRNLVLIGNGFDRWQDLPTSYEQFRQYYFANLDRILTEKGYSRYDAPGAVGGGESATAVELVYGNPFYPTEMKEDFFWNFETELAKLDDQRLNLYFGRSREGLALLSKLVDEAQDILRTAFGEWIASIGIEEKTPAFRFPKNCYFVNFNYTDTLEKRFGVDPRDICSIHGSAADPASIIVGHATHPEKAFQELIEHHFMTPLQSDGLPRYEGLYAVEDALYRTDKHVEDNIDRLCAALVRRGVHMEDIEHIYVLGHSFGDPDLDYFRYLDQVTRCGCDYDALSAAERIDKGLLMLIAGGGEALSEALLMRQIELNIEYAAHHRDRAFAGAASFYPELDKIDEENGVTYREEEAAEAVRQRFLFEQTDRTHKVLQELAAERGLPDVPEGCHSVLRLADYLDWGHEQRRRNAVWHISYCTPKDEKRIRAVMKLLGQKRYTLYPTIDRCLETLRA